MWGIVIAAAVNVVNDEYMSALNSTNRNNIWAEQYQQRWEPAYPEAAAPEYDPLMSSLLDLLAKDRESNSTD